MSAYSTPVAYSYIVGASSYYWCKTHHLNEEEHVTFSLPVVSVSKPRKLWELCLYQILQFIGHRIPYSKSCCLALFCVFTHDWLVLYIPWCVLKSCSSYMAYFSDELDDEKHEPHDPSPDTSPTPNPDIPSHPIPTPNVPDQLSFGPDGTPTHVVPYQSCESEAHYHGSTCYNHGTKCTGPK